LLYLEIVRFVNLKLFFNYIISYDGTITAYLNSTK
jgi:hypothetical protein